MGIQDRIVGRFLSAGDVVEFRPNVHNHHFVKIKNVKYFLSDDPGPLMEALEGLGGTRIEGPQHGSKFKYLWVYDTDKQLVHMWRSTDGNYKVSERASGMASKIRQLDKRQEINRVDHATYLIIKREMDKLEKEEMAAMKRTIEDSYTDTDKIVNEYTREYFEEYVRPLIDRAVAAVEDGAIPFGFKPHDPNPANLKRQMLVKVISDVMNKKFTEALVEKYIKDKGFDLEAPGVDIQAVQWAVSQYLYGIYDEYLPERVSDEDE